MSNLTHEITTSRLVFGVSSEDKCKVTGAFIEFFTAPSDDNSNASISTLKARLDCFEHDPISKFSENQPNPTKICGVLVAVTHSCVCDIPKDSLKAAEKIFRDVLSEYSKLVLSEEKDEIHILKPTLLLFVEGVTRWEAN